MNPRPVVVNVGYCPRGDVGTQEFVVRRAAFIDSSLFASGSGLLHIGVHNNQGDRRRPIARANVRVFRGDTVRADSLLLSSATDERGWVRYDRVSPGSVFVQARAIGYQGHGEVVRIRPGFRDTVQIGLYLDINCLT